MKTQLQKRVGLLFLLVVAITQLSTAQFNIMVSNYI